MKFKTFRNLVVVGGVALASLAVWKIGSCIEEQRLAALAESDRRAAELELQRQQAALAPVPSSPSTPAASTSITTNPGAIRLLAGGPIDGYPTPEAYLIATLGQPASTDKLKDVTNGRGTKVNVYNENGVWARAKADIDRDEKWDESWYVDAGIVVRRIAPDDDERYTRELRWFSGVWAEVHDGTPPPEPATPDEPATPTAPAIATGRECDATMLRLISTLPVEEKIKDATKGQPYKINLYSDDKVRWNRAKIDLDRDDKFDEKWDFKPGDVVERQVAPADDEQYTETYVLTAGAWVRK